MSLPNDQLIFSKILQKMEDGQLIIQRIANYLNQTQINQIYHTTDIPKYITEDIEENPQDLSTTIQISYETHIGTQQYILSHCEQQLVKKSIQEILLANLYNKVEG